ncbi:Cytochrome P450 [Corchorus capsularis]|uniref:Cytochrome P450 n=1 Tax=Corchorus capsularis TaxID=210143 RepID=A0A1R3IS58_COCAP|nr:Cytochrome P450 [Corchorus capsularis]
MEIFMSVFRLLPLNFVFISVFFSLLHAISRASKLSKIGPPTYPIIGCLISFYKNRTRLLDWYTELLAESATNTIVVNRLGARRTIVTANSDNVEYMLKTNFNNFPKGKPFTEILGDFLGYGIFNVDGELWKMQRKLASHAFSTNSLREFMMTSLEQEVENHLLPYLESLSSSSSSKVVDLQDLLRNLAFNMICKVSLGVDRCYLDPSLPVSPLNKAFDMASEICAKRGAAPLFLVWKVKKWLGIGSEKKLKDAVDEVHAYIEDLIREKKRDIDNCGDQDLLSRLILAGHDEEVVRDMAISFIMAGRDTTSAAMTWLFWLLSWHPVIEQELVKEIKNKKEQNNLLDYESLKELKLLQASICESMRLYPPVAWDSKHALMDDILPDGTLVQAGDRVTYFPYGMGRMEALWGKDWFEFRPSRWFSEPSCSHGGSLKKVCPYKFPVFQAGPRVCLGKEMAFIQMKYVVASILSRFQIRPVGSEKPVFVPFLTAHMAGGLKVVIQKR